MPNRCRSRIEVLSKSRATSDLRVIASARRARSRAWDGAPPRPCAVKEACAVRALTLGSGPELRSRYLARAPHRAPILKPYGCDDREQPLLFHARTIDFQDVTVQATITYRIVDPAVAAARIDFEIDPEGGMWRSTPLEQIGGLLTELAQQHALDLLARVGQDGDGIACVPVQ